jgi:hypothetical protein
MAQRFAQTRSPDPYNIEVLGFPTHDQGDGFWLGSVALVGSSHKRATSGFFVCVL